jgi:hypothetical protein
MNSEEFTKPKQPDTDEIARRYNNRPGFDLVSCLEVGLPVYKVTVDAITQVRKPIPPIEEYVLKTLDAGLCLEEEIAGFLGLELPAVRDAMVNLRGSEDIDLIASPGERMQEWKLTKKGKRSLDEARTMVPEERTFSINFDGILRRVRWYGRLERGLLHPRDLRNQGIMEVPPFPGKPPELSDLKLTDVDEVIRTIEKESKRKRSQERDLLALKAIERRERFFQPALALLYKAKESDEVQVAFAIDRVLSEEHENTFASADGAKKMRIKEQLWDSDPTKFVEIDRKPLEVADKLKNEITSVKTKLETVKTNLEQTKRKKEQKLLEEELKEQELKIQELEAQLANISVRRLEVYEHRPLLEKALKESQQRLLIISPWIRAGATNKWLIQELEKLLKRGVEVFIGYGLGEDGEEKTYDKKAEKKVRDLADKYKNNFVFDRLGDTHAKILISDKKFAVVGSFNWLSFKGDPKRTFRDERSILVSDPQKIDEWFEEEIERFPRK